MRQRRSLILPMQLGTHDLRRSVTWATIVAMLLFTAPVLRAQGPEESDPFGLPTPRNAKQPGAVVLHGGGRAGLSDDIRQEFVRLAGGREARIVLIPSDMCQLGKDADGKPLAGGETPAAYERRLARPSQYGGWSALGEHMQVADFRFLYRKPNADPDDREYFDSLERATGVWLPAYDQEWLPREFAREYPKATSRFQWALREVVARGGVVGGLGGGMSSLPETIIAGDEPAEFGWVRARLGFGLALFDGAVVDQNFDARAGRLERLTDLLRNGARLNRLAGIPGVERRTIGVGVGRQTAVILQGNSVRAMGSGKAHIFLKSNGDRTITWRTLAPGDPPIVLRSSTSAPPKRSATSIEPDRSSSNPFGMPEPVDPVRPGTVVLHGGGSTDELIDLFPRLTYVAKPRIVHCPAARESCRPSAESNGETLAKHLENVFSPWRELQRRGRASNLTFVTTGTRGDANRPEFVKPLTQADALWFCGGDQRPLADLLVDRLRPTLFQNEVFNILRRGGVVGGTSAGLAVMPEIMIEGGEAANGRPAEATLSRGLGVMKHVLAEQHFDARSGRIERLTGLLRNHRRLASFSPTSQPYRMVGLAVEEETAILAQGNRIRVVGRNLAHVFLQSSDPRTVTWHALKSGDAAVLVFRNGEQVLLLDEWEFGDGLRE